jgi:hypothetical protein
MRLALIALAVLAAPAALAQQTPGPACAVDAALPRGLDDWNGKAALSSASGASDIAKSAVTLGKGYEAALLQTPKIAFPVQPEKPGGSVSHGGLFEFTVETAGAYTIALSSAAWIDVIENGQAVTPASFGHGPQCTTIRKQVVFDLQPGKHVLQISGNAEPKMKLMVHKTPALLRSF